MITFLASPCCQSALPICITAKIPHDYRLRRRSQSIPLVQACLACSLCGPPFYLLTTVTTSAAFTLQHSFNFPSCFPLCLLWQHALSTSQHSLSDVQCGKCGAVSSKLMISSPSVPFPVTPLYILVLHAFLTGRAINLLVLNGLHYVLCCNVLYLPKLLDSYDRIPQLFSLSPPGDFPDPLSSARQTASFAMCMAGGHLRGSQCVMGIDAGRRIYVGPQSRSHPRDHLDHLRT